MCKAAIVQEVGSAVKLPKRPQMLDKRVASNASGVKMSNLYAFGTRPFISNCRTQKPGNMCKWGS